MRVLQVVGSMNMGGLETFVMNVYRNIDRSHIRFDFLYITKEKCYYDDEIKKLGGRIYRITGRNADVKKHCRELKAFIKHNRDIDVVHIHALRSFCILDAIIMRKAGIKNIIIHSHASLTSHKFLNNMLKQLIPFFARKMIACSDKAAAWLFPKRSIKKVMILPNGVDVLKYGYDSKIANMVRESLGLEGKCIVGHVGRFTEVKNHTFLLEVFYHFHRKNQNSVLVMVGDGPLRDDIAQKAEELGIGKSVMFLGIRNDVENLLQAFDIFVFPSLREGLPVSVVEAQAAGVRCYLSDTITKDVKITRLVWYLPLNRGAEFWAREIEKGLTAGKSHMDVSDEIRKARFDIRHTAGELCLLYKEMTDEEIE